MAAKKAAQKPRKVNDVPEGFEVLDDSPPSQWEPEIGESIQGALEAPQKGKFGVYRVLACDDGVRRYVPNHAALRRLLAMEVGQRVWIRYDGEAQSKKGQAFNSYTVAVHSESEVPF